MRRNKGLTLVEVIISVAIFMIVILFSFPILTQSALTNIKSESKREAQEYGVMVSEELHVKAKAHPNYSNLEKDLLENDFLDFGQGFVKIGANNLELSKDDLTVKLMFSDDFKRVKISVHSKQAMFETMEWLNYAG